MIILCKEGNVNSEIVFLSVQEMIKCLTKKISCLKMDILTMKRVSIWKHLFTERKPGGVKLLADIHRTCLGVTVRKDSADQRYGHLERVLMRRIRINQGGTADIFGP